MSISSVLVDSVPVWMIIGIVAAGGWLAEHEGEQSERITTLEARTDAYHEDVREIKDGIIRLEQRAMNP